MMRSRAIKTIAVVVIILAVVFAGAYAGFSRALLRGAPWAVDLAIARVGRAMVGQRVMDTALEVELLPAERRLQGRVTLVVRSEHGPRRAFTFLLNPGLEVTRATVAGQDARLSRRWCGLTLTGPRTLAQDEEATIEIDYAGTPAYRSLDPAWLIDDEVVLPMLSFWYPLDLRSFTRFQCTATVPEGMVVVAPGAASVQVPEQRRTQVTWREPRPVLGATLAAGRFEKITRRHGDVTCTVYYSKTHPLDGEALMDDLGRAHHSLSALLGPDGFASLSAVVSPNAARAFNGGNGIIVLDTKQPPDGADRFVAIARLVAQNWWGGTVTGRWLGSRAEAGAWLVEGLAEYSAWQALRARRGPDVYLRFLEARPCPPGPPNPLGSISLLDCFAPGSETRDFVRVRGAQVAVMLEHMLGRDALLNGCRNFMRIHRHTPASAASLFQELELAGEIQLDEFARLWLDRTGALDYSLDEADFIDNKVRLTVSSPGDIPALMPVEIAFVGDKDVQFREFEPGAGTFEFELGSPVSKVILDPHFTLPDAARGNNVWPRQLWPQAVVAGPNGDLALLAWSDWTSFATDSITILSAQREHSDRIKLAQPLSSSPEWASDRNALTFRARPYSYLWTPDSGLAVTNRLDALVDTAESHARSLRAALRDPNSPRSRRRPAANSPWKTSRVDENRGFMRKGCLTGSGREIIYSEKTTGEWHGLFSITGYAPAGDFAWSARDVAAVFVDRSGKIMRVAPEQESPTVALELGYSVHDSSVSEDGAYVAWRDPAGRLRVALVDSPVPRYVDVPGEVIAYDWAGEDALFCITAEPPRGLPMLCHADYALWRVPADTLEPERLDFDPAHP